MITEDVSPDSVPVETPDAAPADDAAADNGEEEVQKPAEETQAPAEPTFADMSEIGEVPVAAHTETGEILARTTMPLGEVKAENVKEDGYVFVGAAVDGVKVKAVRRLDTTQDFYYITETSDEPVLLKNGQTIVLTYKEAEKDQAPTPEKAPVKAPAQAADPETEEVSVYFYLYTQGSNVPAVQEVKTEKGEQTVAVPQKAGYTAYLANEDGEKVGTEALTAITQTFEDDTDINIFYEAGTAGYVVKHQFGSNVETEEKSGKVGALTDAEPKEKAGWYPLYASNTFINADGSTVVTIEYVKSVYQLQFDSAGGSFIVPVEMDIDSTIDLGKYAPTREGYEFAGWTLNGKKVTEVKGTDVANGKSVTVTAAWNPAVVQYTVRYWRQNVSQTGYEYADSETAYARTGTTVKGENNQNTTDKNSDYYGFKFNEAASGPQTVAADGSTVVDVKYDRVMCHITYKIRKRIGWTDQWVELEDKAASGAYGAPYNGWFHEYDGKQYYWYQGPSSGSGCVLLNTFDFETAGYTHYTIDETTGDWYITFYGKEENNLQEITYFNEQYDGSFAKADVTGATNTGGITVREKFAGYTLYKYDVPGRGHTPDESQMTSASYWAQRNDLSEGKNVSGSSIYIASKLKTYSIDFQSNNKVVRKVNNVKYTTPIEKVSEYNGFVPEAPKPYLEFAGWYLDPIFANPVDENATMPNANLILYAKWEAKDLNVTIHYNNGQADGKDTVKGGTAYGELAQPADKKDHTFAGWYIDEACTKPYSGSMPIEEDTDIYAKWTHNDVVTVDVKYVEVDEDGKPVKELAAPDAVKARPGTTITLQALPFEDLRAREEFINHDVTEGDNTVTFYYERICDRYYQIVYKDEDGNVIKRMDKVNARLRPTVTAKANSKDIPDNYELVGERIQTVDSRNLSKDEDKPTEIVFTVRKKTADFTLDAASAAKVYDGTPLALPEASSTTPDAVIMYSIDGGKTWTEAAPDITNVWESTTVQVKAVAKGYQDSEVKTVTLTVAPRPVTAKAGSASKIYDGDPLIAPAGTMEGLVTGEEASVVSEGSIKYVGTVESIVKEINWTNGDSRNYNVTEQPGTLEITVRPDGQKYEITVEAISGGVTYNGRVQSVEGLENTKFSFNNHEYTVEGLSASAAGKDAGEYTSKVGGTVVVKDAAGKDVTDNFAVNTKDGKFTIDKASVTVTAKSASKPYDGKPLTAGATAQGFVDSEEIQIDTEGSQTVPGESANKVAKIHWTDTTKESNYDVTTVDGKLTVTKPDVLATVTVTAVSGTKTYNGQEQSVSGINGLTFDWEGRTYTVEGLSASAKGTDAGKYINEIKGEAIVKDAAGNDVSECFHVETVNGLLTIAPKKATVKTESRTWEYDGKIHTAGGSIEGLVNGETAEVVTKGSVQLPNEEAVNDVDHISWGSAKAANYTLSYEKGTLKITDRAEKYAVELTANSDEAVYDGEEHTVEGWKTTVFEVDGSTYTVSGLTASAKGTDAGEYATVIEGAATVKDLNGNDVTSQFAVETVAGKLTVAKRQVVLTSGTAEKVYDGKPVSNETVEVAGEGFADGEEPGYVFTNSGNVNVGEYENTFEVKDTDSFKSDNYDVEQNFGKLTITKAKPEIEATIDGAVIGAEGYTRKYDGTTSSLAATAVNQEGTAIDGQFTYQVNDEEPTETAPTFKNAGTYVVTITTGNENCEQKSVTVNVEITRREVHIKSADAEKVYDGKAVTGHDHVEITGDGFVEGEQPEDFGYGTYVDAGEYENTFEYQFGKRPEAGLLARALNYLSPSEDPDHIADNYVITTETGTVVIRKASADLLNLNAADKTVIYNGKEQSLDAATSDVEDAKIEYSADNGETWTDTMPAFKDAGEYAVKVRAAHKNYEDAETTAVLTVLPAELIVETESAEKEYDGKPLTAGGKLTGVADGDEVVLKTTGSQTEPGTSVNTYKLEYGNTKASNYTVTEKLGTLTVKAAAKKDEKPKQDVPTAVGFVPEFWASLMGAAGVGLFANLKLSRKEKNKKNKK